MKTYLWLLTLFLASSLYAVDDTSTFELEGNVVDDTPSIAPDDWETLELGGGDASLYVRIVDKNGSDNIFTGGGSKTPLDFPGYKWKSSPPPPDKTNITNAFAANYIVGGEQVLYFGADLYADNGDAELAFWFLQDEVGTNPDGTFHGVHVLGDVYVAVKFANGGREAFIAVYAWDPSCTKNDRTPTVPNSCAAGNIKILIPGVEARCDGSGGIACAITNLLPTSAVWAYTPKSGLPGIYPPTTLFEGGINIFELYGQNLCFSSFMVSTGASTSFTSTAKDFALGDFNVCSVAATKTCVNDDETNDVPTAISYNVRGCGWNDGSGVINLTDLQNNIGGLGDYVPSDLTWYEPPLAFDPTTDCENATALKNAVDNGSVVTASTYDLAGGEALVYQFSETTSLNGPADVVTLSAEGTDGAEVDPDTASATCPIRIFDADLSANKTCEAVVEDVGLTLAIRIDVSGQICNDGEVDLTNLTLNDYVADGVISLTPESYTVEVGKCVKYSGYYYPQSIPAGDTCPFMDQVTVVVDAPINTSGTFCVENNDGTSTCTVDSNSATCLLRVTNDDNDCSTGVVNP